MAENNAGGSSSVFRIESDFQVLRAENPGDRPFRLEHPIEPRCLQFHFCLKGQARFLFNDGHYVVDLASDQSLLLYNPQSTLPLRAELAPNSWLVTLILSIRHFHALFTREADYIPFLSPENQDKKYYRHDPVNASVAVVLSQLWNEHMHPSVRSLYFRAKAYELLSLSFNRNADTQAEQCPILVDEAHLRRIRRAKEIVLERMAEPPTLAELAEETGLSLKRLKEGFKQIYGDSVYSFLFDHKMETARKMLESGRFNVNEVGLKVGYSTASHFIEAFKKKYNTTPKKYLMALAQQGI